MNDNVIKWSIMIWEILLSVEKRALVEKSIKGKTLVGNVIC
jgi:hypothetical protein